MKSDTSVLIPGAVGLSVAAKIPDICTNHTVFCASCLKATGDEGRTTRIVFLYGTFAEKRRAHAIPAMLHPFIAGLNRFRRSLFERRGKF